MFKRNWKCPIYRKWRKGVLARDKGRCQFHNCADTKKIQIHHIVPVSVNPGLYLDPNNGIALCKKHHQLVTKNEATWAPYFVKIIYENNRRHTRKKPN